MMKADFSIAIHESAHAAACRAMDRDVYAVTLCATGEGEGLIWFDGRCTNPTDTRDSLFILAAGDAAQKIHNPATPGSESDLCKMQSEARRLLGLVATDEQIAAEIELAKRRASRFVAANWAHVMDVARSLMECHALVSSGPHISRVEDLDNA